MARKKVAIKPEFTLWSEVDNAFREIIECEGCIDEVEVDMNRRITEVKADAEQRTKPMRERISTLETQIRDFVSAHRAELNGKTRTLNFGQTGFRLSTKLVVPSGKIPDVLEALKRHKMSDCITTKTTVNKEALKKYKSEDILKTGAYLRSDDEFWYEVDKEQLRSQET